MAKIQSTKVQKSMESEASSEKSDVQELSSEENVSSTKSEKKSFLQKNLCLVVGCCICTGVLLVALAVGGYVVTNMSKNKSLSTSSSSLSNFKTGPKAKAEAKAEGKDLKAEEELKAKLEEEARKKKEQELLAVDLKKKELEAESNNNSTVSNLNGGGGGPGPESPGSESNNNSSNPGLIKPGAELLENGSNPPSSHQNSGSLESNETTVVPGPGTQLQNDSNLNQGPGLPSTLNQEDFLNPNNNESGPGSGPSSAPVNLGPPSTTFYVSAKPGLLYRLKWSIPVGSLTTYPKNTGPSGEPIPWVLSFEESPSEYPLDPPKGTRMSEKLEEKAGCLDANGVQQGAWHHGSNLDWVDNLRPREAIIVEESPTVKAPPGPNGIQEEGSQIPVALGLTNPRKTRFDDPDY